MDSIKFFLQSQLPAYLKSLPLPKTFAGFADLDGQDWVRLLPTLIFIFLVFYLLIANILDFGSSQKNSRKEKSSGTSNTEAIVNPSVDKEKDKVVTAVDMEDIGEKAVYCRCWRSKKFPLCDGSHNAFNKQTGDNTGPLIVKRAQPEKKSE